MIMKMLFNLNECISKLLFSIAEKAIKHDNLRTL